MGPRSKPAVGAEWQGHGTGELLGTLVLTKGGGTLSSRGCLGGPHIDVGGGTPTGLTHTSHPNPFLLPLFLLAVTTGRNPCANRNGGCMHTCQVLRGLAHCECHTGYRLAADRKACEGETPSPGGCPARGPIGPVPLQPAWGQDRPGVIGGLLSAAESGGSRGGAGTHPRGCFRPEPHLGSNCLTSGSVLFVNISGVTKRDLLLREKRKGKGEAPA